jgi:molecular chaperone GrpE (heat shock protein)
MMNRQTPEEEVEDLKAHIEVLKEELKAAEEDLNELERTTWRDIQKKRGAHAPLTIKRRFD